MSEGSDSESSSSSSEEEFPPEVNEEFEKSFFKTLSSLKNKDPSIYDKDNTFFDEKTTIAPVKRSKSKSSDKKPFLLKEYERMGDEDDDLPDCDKDVSDLPYNAQQKHLKESFKSFLKDSDSEDESTLLKPSVKTKEETEKEEADYIQWLKGQKQELEDKGMEKDLKNLRDYWNSDNLEEGEAFLRDYILNKRFLDEEESSEEDALSEDSEVFEEQEQFEQEFNMRFETGVNPIRRFPRNVEGSLRRKDDKRSRKRAEIKERKLTEKKKKRDNINRLKKIKLSEISERLNKLQELTGNEKPAFDKEDILKDFDPNEHDKKMSEIYNDQFYDGEELEKPSIDDLDLENVDDTYDQYDEPIPTTSKREKKTRTKRKKEAKKKTFKDILTGDKPIYDPSHHQSFQKYMDEYFGLDCEDFIEDLPCRFKYRQVEPNDFGLTVEEILAADDKDLNRWSSIKKIYKVRPAHVERNEAKIYKYKGQDEVLKQKILPSLYKTVTDEDNQNDSEQNQSSKKSKKKKKGKNKKQSEIEHVPTDEDENIANEPLNVTKDSITKKNKRKAEHLNSEVVQSDEDENIKNETKNTPVKNKKRKADVDESEPVMKPLEESTENDQSINNNSFQKGFNRSRHYGKSKNSFNKFKKNFKGRFNKSHDFHDSRLSAYGINPKKFKQKT